MQFSANIYEQNNTCQANLEQESFKDIKRHII